MISLGVKPAKAESQVSTPDDTVPGQHRADFRDVPGESDQQQRRKMWILTTTQMSSGLLQMLSIPEFSPHLSWAPQHPRKACIMVLTALSSNYLCIYLLDRLGLLQGRN